jgi:hypothetical protein
MTRGVCGFDCRPRGDTPTLAKRHPHTRAPAIALDRVVGIVVASRTIMSKWFVAAALLAAACAVSAASAGKHERDLMTQEAIPAARAAEANYKASCGCALAVVIDASIDTAEEIHYARYIADEVANGAPKYCTDDGSRKALCKMKTLRIAGDTIWNFTFDAGVGLATTNGHGYPRWDTMTSTLDR